MEPKTFSVLVNTTTKVHGAEKSGSVRIDDLRIDLAKEHSATLGWMVSYDPWIEAIEQGRSLELNPWYDTPTEPSDPISESLLRWVFGVFQSPEVRPCRGPGDHSLRSYCHALKIISFLDMPCQEDDWVTKILAEYPLQTFVAAVHPMYNSMPRRVQQHLMYGVSQVLKREYFYCNSTRTTQIVDAACLVLADLIMTNVDLDVALVSTYRGILADDPDLQFFRWNRLDICLTRGEIFRSDVPRLLPLGDTDYVGFLFSDDPNPQPNGWVAIDLKDGTQQSIREYRKNERGIWCVHNRRHYRSHPGDFTFSEMGRFLSTGCVMNENPYEDGWFVQKVCTALGIGLDEIKAKSAE